MSALHAINSRRSIRNFKPDPVPDETIATILNAGIKAPSGKNRQPWQFIVLSGDRKEEMLRVMEQGLLKKESEGMNVRWAENTRRIMRQAPITVFVFNPYGTHPWVKKTVEEQIQELVDVQSVGAAIQNMLLAATELGIGSLWICDVFYAYEELCKWLNKDCQMVAAVSLGYADEAPGERPRKGMDEVTEW